MLKLFLCIGCVLLVACSSAFTASQTRPTTRGTIDFAPVEVGSAPIGFTEAVTGEGGPGRWAVDPEGIDGGRRVLKQLSTIDKSLRFPMCILDSVSARDVTASVQFKPISGKVDQAAGIAVRVRSENNYYVVRANALENNVRLYKVVEGQRIQFAGKDFEVPSGKWSTLSITVRGAHFTVRLNDHLLFEADDDQFGNAGKIALWTKADSVTAFDGLTYESFDP